MGRLFRGAPAAAPRKPECLLDTPIGGVAERRDSRQLESPFDLWAIDPRGQLLIPSRLGGAKLDFWSCLWCNRRALVLCTIGGAGGGVSWGKCRQKIENQPGRWELPADGSATAMSSYDLPWILKIVVSFPLVNARRLGLASAAWRDK